tara:strand:- start:922 stop:1710 length:789 start_codon:yes stop_codon:yes gene_type:complete
MGIISLQDKYINNDDSKYKTTGKEVRYHTAAKLASTPNTPKITGHYFWRHASNTVAFGAFWEAVDGEVYSLLFESTEGVTFKVNERADTAQTADDDPWYDFEIDLTGMPNGRLVFYVRRSNYSCDLALDDIVFQPSFGSAVSFDPSTQSVRDNDMWYRSGNSVLNMSSYEAAKLRYVDNDGSPAAFTDAMGSSSAKATLRWNYRIGSTPTGNTGPDNAADNNNNTFYMYFEGSGNYSPSTDRGGYVRWQDFRNIETGAVQTT